MAIERRLRTIKRRLRTIERIDWGISTPGICGDWGSWRLLVYKHIGILTQWHNGTIGRMVYKPLCIISIGDIKPFHHRAVTQLAYWAY